MNKSENNSGGCLAYIIVIIVVLVIAKGCFGTDTKDSGDQKKVTKQSISKDDGKKYKVLLEVAYEPCMINKKIDIYLDGKKIIKEQKRNSEKEYKTNLREGKHTLYAKTGFISSKKETFTVNAGNVDFAFRFEYRILNGKLKVEQETSSQAPFCWKCQDDTGRGYLLDNGNYSYVCDECSKRCMDCIDYGEYVPAKKYITWKGKAVFLCKDCLKKDKYQ